MDNITEVGTIRQTLSRLRAEGFAISENALRTWVKTGAIPAVYAGKKAFLFYPNVRGFLEGNTIGSFEPNVTGGIRKIT